MLQREDKEYLLKIGEVVIGLDCGTYEYAASLERYFGRKNAAQDAHLRIQLKIIAHNEMSPVPNSLYFAKKKMQGGFSICSNLIQARYFADTGDWELVVKNILTKDRMTRVFEQILYQAFYSAAKKCRYNGCLIHSSGVIHAGDGFLFVGPSESGKSTVAVLSRGETILNDEICLVHLKREDIDVCGTPFNGFFKGKAEGAAPLKAVFLLEQGQSHRLYDLNRTTAIAGLVQQIVPPVGLEDELNKKAYALMIKLAEKLCRTVPVLKLQFRPDAGFWDVIDRHCNPNIS